ncbi:MAG: YfhO family protein [Firmicutes bacterium]|nr:YfhO family protein [Bacillota bacterium]
MRKKEALIPVVMTGILSSMVYLFFGLFPYGEWTLAWCDARQQVVPLLLELKAILSWDQSLFLNLQNAGGMDMWGVLLFFMASPLHLLVMVVPEGDMFRFFNVLVMVKMMLCSLTAYLFFRKKFPRLGILMCSLLAVMYAFSGFNLLFYQNVVWLDTAYLFPLLLLSVDKLLTEEKPGMYIGILCAELIVHFYLSYMVVLFLLLGVGLYLILCCDKEKRRRGTLLFMGASGVAAVLTAVIWIPALSQYFTSARSSGLLSNLRGSKWFPSLVTTIPLLYCTGIFAPILIFFPYGQTKERPELKWLLIMGGLMIVPLLLDPINKLWHTGNYQCFPARYGYITVFLLLMVTAATLDHMRQRADRSKWLGRAAAALSVVVLAAFLLPYLLKKREQMDAYVTTLFGNADSFLALTIAFVVIAGAYLLCLALRDGKCLSQRGLAIALWGLFIWEGFFYGGVYMGYAAEDLSDYNQVLDLGENLSDEGFYRVKNETKDLDANWIGAAGMPTSGHYTSLTDEDYLFSLKKLGYSAYWTEVESRGGTAFSDALMGNRYGVENVDDITSADQVVYQNESYAIVKSAYSLPSALITKTAVPAMEMLWFGDRFEAQQALVRSVFGSEEQLFVRYSPSEVTNLEIAETKIMLGDEDEVGTLTYYIQVDGEQILYFDCFGGRYTTRVNESENEACKIMVNDQVHTMTYPTKKMNGILELGTFENEVVKVQVVLSEEVPTVSFGVAGLKTSVLKELVANANASEITVEGRSVKVCVEHASAGETLLIMMPYSEGYTARVNGKATEVYPALSGFMCVKLTSGENQVELVYHNYWIVVGLVVSVAAIGLLWLFVHRKGCLLRLEWKWLEKLPLIWFGLMVVMVYIFPMLIARGGV